MTKDEALKMAIEKAMIPNTKAMQQSQSNPVFLAQGSKLVAGHEGVFVEDKNLKEIVSYHETHCAELDNVIEQLQAENKDLETIQSATRKANIDLVNQLTALEQPTTQEPVGYVDEFGNFEFTMQMWMEEEPNVTWTPLYTHPKEWQGLSDDELEEAFVHTLPYEYGHAIEAKLKEKNNV